MKRKPTKAEREDRNQIARDKRAAERDQYRPAFKINQTLTLAETNSLVDEGDKCLCRVSKADVAAASGWRILALHLKSQQLISLDANWFAEYRAQLAKIISRPQPGFSPKPKTLLKMPEPKVFQMKSAQKPKRKPQNRSTTMPTTTTGRQIAKAFTFDSSSGSGSYQTLQYTDGTTSCDCKGWTRRIAPDGSRSCKHTRTVEMDRGQVEAASFIDYGLPIAGKRKANVDAPAQAAPSTFAGGNKSREFDFS